MVSIIFLLFQSAFITSGKADKNRKTVIKVSGIIVAIGLLISIPTGIISYNLNQNNDRHNNQIMQTIKHNINTKIQKSNNIIADAKIELPYAQNQLKHVIITGSQKSVDQATTKVKQLTSIIDKESKNIKKQKAIYTNAKNKIKIIIDKEYFLHKDKNTI